MLWSLTGLWWWLRLIGGISGMLPASALHGLLMGLGFMPLFIAGFVFTTAPRWLDLPAQSNHGMWASASCIGLGWCTLLLSDVIGLRLLASLGVLLVGLTLTYLAVRLLKLCRTSTARYSPHAFAMSAGLACIALAQMMAALAIRIDQPLLMQLATHLGLEFGVAAVFAVALQRLTPFLDQPKGLFVLLLLGLLTRGVLGIATHIGWSINGGLRAFAAIGFAVLALLLWKDAFTPETAAARRTPLVAQLHWGYLWLGLGFALEAWAQTYGDVGLAPLHALTLGFMCTTLLAMASRVTAVNYGRSVAVDAWLWFLQILLQVTTLARLINALYPTGTGLFRFIAVTGFMLVGLGWAARYLPWLLQPKPPRQLV
jgi:uncharacterized protein involved in response to NO